MQGAASARGAKGVVRSAVPCSAGAQTSLAALHVASVTQVTAALHLTGVDVQQLLARCDEWLTTHVVLEAGGVGGKKGGAKGDKGCPARVVQTLPPPSTFPPAKVYLSCRETVDGSVHGMYAVFKELYCAHAKAVQAKDAAAYLEMLELLKQLSSLPLPVAAATEKVSVRIGKELSVAPALESCAQARSGERCVDLRLGEGVTAGDLARFVAPMYHPKDVVVSMSPSGRKMGVNAVVLRDLVKTRSMTLKVEHAPYSRDVPTERPQQTYDTRAFRRKNQSVPPPKPQEHARGSGAASSLMFKVNTPAAKRPRTDGYA